MRRIRVAFVLAFAISLALLASRPAPAQENEFFMYFGTYTGFKYVSYNATHGVGESHSKGIYVSRLRPATGEVSEPELAAEIVNPAFLAVHPNHRFLYAVTEDPLSLGPELDHASYVTAFAIDPATGKLKLLNKVPTGGTSTCYISMDKTGRYVMMANFGSGSVSVVRVKDDGSLGEQTAFVQHIGRGSSALVAPGPHPHSIDVSLDNRYAIVSDLGLDKLLIYHFDAETGRLSPLEPAFAAIAPDSGPRHFTFDASGKFGYQLNEMSGVVNVFAWDAANGTLTNVGSAGITNHPSKAKNASAEIQISPDGRYLYESNRWHLEGQPEWEPGSIGVFAIDPARGTLTKVEETPTGGILPRSFAIDPTGGYLFALHQQSNTVTQFKVDPNSGHLTNTGKSLKVDTPVCLKFVPTHP